MRTPSILIVDDERQVRKVLEYQIRPAGFEVVSVASAGEALRRLQLASPDLILSDISMPEMDGLAFLAAVQEQSHRANCPPLGVIMLTAHDNIDLCVRAMQLGALDYLVKPVRRDKLLDTIHKNLALQTQRLAAWEADQRRASDAHRQVNEISELLRRSAAVREETLNSLVQTLDAREHETGHHSQRTSKYAAHLAKAMGLSETDCEIIRRGALVHDLGKVGLADSILLKSGPLSPEEVQQMRLHPETGYSILTNMSDFDREAEIALGHHERYDGSGYPRGLRGDAIPFGARLFAVIDAFDAMTSDRPYCGARPYSEAAAEIAAGAGTQFDPQIVDAFLGIPPYEWVEIAGKVARSVEP